MEINNLSVLDYIWFSQITQLGGQIGIIKCKDLTTNEIKCYIGSGKGINQDEDIKHIVQFGSKFHKSIAERLFKENGE